MKLFFAAGEASGDQLGANLLAALKTRVPDLEVFGMGGPEMARAGLRVLRDARELNVMGLVEVLRHLPRLLRLVASLGRAAIAERPDAAVLIDVPDFNLRLARRLSRAGIPVIFYVGPSVWAWRPGRVRKFKNVVRRMLVLFPFELPIWRAGGVDAVCVGHPLADEIPAAAAATLGDPRTVALLPGSRPGEIRRHLSVLLDAAARLKGEGLADRFVLPVAPTVDAEGLAREVEASPARGLVTLVRDERGSARRRQAVAETQLALVASGTATLETALLGRPQVVIYRVGWLSGMIFRRLLKVRFVGLVNLLAGRRVAPELLQEACTADGLVREARALLANGPERDAAMRGIADVRAALGPTGAADRAAEAVLEVLRSRA